MPHMFPRFGVSTVKRNGVEHMRSKNKTDLLGEDSLNYFNVINADEINLVIMY